MHLELCEATRANKTLSPAWRIKGALLHLGSHAVLINIESVALRAVHFCVVTMCAEKKNIGTPWTTLTKKHALVHASGDADVCARCLHPDPEVSKLPVYIMYSSKT